MPMIDPRTERPLPDWAELLFENQVDLERRQREDRINQQYLNDRMDQLVADYAQAAQDAEAALALIPDLATEISNLQQALADAPPGAVPAAVQAAADTLESKAQVALSAAQAALATPGPATGGGDTPTPDPTPAPDPTPLPDPTPPVDTPPTDVPSPDPSQPVDPSRPDAPVIPDVPAPANDLPPADPNVGPSDPVVDPSS